MGKTYNSIFRKPWPLWIGAVLLALANIAMFAYARAIGVFPQMSMWGAMIRKKGDGHLY